METNPYDSAAAGGIMAFFGIIMFISFAIWLIVIIAYWKIFDKAGKPGWAAIIPIYNIIVLLEIVNKPVWWIILLIIPIVNVVIAIMLVHQLSTAFGQGVGMTLLLIFLPFIGFPVLAFGNSQYTPPAGTTSPSY